MRFRISAGGFKRAVLHAFTRNVVVSLGVVVSGVVAATQLLYMFPHVSGEKWLLALDMSVLAGLFAFMLLDILQARRELDEWIAGLPLSLRDKMWIRNALFNAYDLGQIADIARIALLKSLQGEGDVVVEHVDVNQALLQKIVELERKVEATAARRSPQAPGEAKSKRRSLSCPHCGSDDVLVDGGYLYCLSCGRVSRVET